jgi:protein tyrosine phosphatase (PTP) superfamily phosphohydrolase (DUF442 family)
MAVEDIRNFVPLSAALATGGQPTEEQVQELAATGYEVVINLGLLDPRYCLPDEAGLVKSLGLVYHHIPVEFQVPTRHDLQQFFAAMEAWAGKRVFVHCAANYRVSSFVALYGEAKLGWSREQAEAYVKRVWEPNEVWTEFMAAARQDSEFCP